jgi:hypothetical protein
MKLTDLIMEIGPVRFTGRVPQVRVRPLDANLGLEIGAGVHH